MSNVLVHSFITTVKYLSNTIKEFNENGGSSPKKIW